MPHNPLICAIDTPDIETAKRLATCVAPHVGMIKLGLEFFTRHGPDAVRQVTREGDVPFFLDLKFHDIPNTVAGAVRSALVLAPAMLTLHACGGAEMMRAAAGAATEEADKRGITKPALLGVTVLTSMNEPDLQSIGVGKELERQVEDLATLAQHSGLDGIVCSPQEAARLRELCGTVFLLVTPGVRPAFAEVGDQKRVMTPQQALQAGADYLVVGRPITQAEDPATAAKALQASLVA